MSSHSPVDAHLDLGPFTLFAIIGKGGMGEVWRGIHRASKIPVAIKVIAQERSLDTDFIHAFVQEVHAVAALNHPGVTRVFDHGRIPIEVAQQCHGKLVAGSPWLAMEFASSGSLDAAPPLKSWNALRILLKSVLAGLAHAHARGIIHRDLKPGNILIGESQHTRRYMLTDFGLAHATHHVIEQGSYEERASSAGTPHYMPPEQLGGQWRSYGPWTDLYALGCVAYELCCGTPPFDGNSFIHIANKHLNTPPPPLRPMFEVPADFEAWVHALMSKPLGQRPTRAAQAAHMLDELDTENMLPAVAIPAASSPSTSSSIFFAPTIAPTDALAGLDTNAPTMLVTRTSAPETLRTLITQDSTRPARLEDASPFPQSWEPAHDAIHHDRVLAGAGLGLFGLREVPLVDRVPSRQHIWDNLRTVYETSTSRAVLIEGPPGSGKSRLCEWMVRRAHETGVATPLHITHHAEPASDDGLLSSLDRFLRCQSLDRAHTYARIHSIFKTFSNTEEEKSRTRQEAILLTTLLRPPCPSSQNELHDDDVPTLKLHGRAERHRAILATLTYLTGPRPLILWMDDLHWSEESVALAEQILLHDLPILLIMTTPSAHHPALEKLIVHPNASLLTLTPLNLEDHRALVAKQLGLQPDLIDHVAQSTHGNPLFAQHLLSDWIVRDALIAQPDGFTHIDGPRPEVPPSLDALWRNKLDHLEELETSTWRGPLHVAAVLGPYFEQNHWLELCTSLHTPCSMNLLQALLTRGLLTYMTQHKEKLTWGHPALRTKVLREARHKGAWETIHFAIAKELSPTRQTITQRQRLIHHLLCAQKLEEARQELALTAQLAQDQSEYELANTLITHHERLCEWMNLDIHDLRRLELIPLLITTYRVRGKFTQALELAERNLPLLDASSRKSALLRADILRAITMIHYLQGSYDISEHTGTEAISLYETYAHYHGLLKVLHTQGWLCVRMGDFTRAMNLFERGDQIGALHQDRIDRAWCLQAIADLHIQRQRPHDAHPYIELALQLFEQGGSRAGLGMALCSKGDVHALQGEQELAKNAYNIADEILTTLHINLRLVSHGKIALIALLEHRLEDAALKIEQILAIPGLNHQFSIRTRMLQAVLAVSRTQHDVLEQQLREAHDILQFATYAYSDLTPLLELAEQRLMTQDPAPSLLTALRNIRRRLHADQQSVVDALSRRPT